MGMTDTYCKAFVTQLDTLILTMQAVKGALNAPVAALIAILEGLQGQIPSLEDDVNAGVSAIQNGISSATPIWEGIDEFQDLLTKCSLLEEAIIDQSPITLANNLVGAVGDTVTGVIDDITDTLSALIEMPAAVAIKKINDLLEKLAVTDALSSFDKLVTCLDAICSGYDVTSKIDDINQILEDVKLNTNGSLDLGTLYSDAGLSAPQIANITTCLDEITTAADESATKAAKAGANVANAVKKLF